jgi:type IV secretory pathway component VirB8
MARQPRVVVATSERWRAYYDEAGKERRAQGHRGRTSRAFRSRRRRRRALLLASVATIGALIATFRIVLVP